MREKIKALLEQRGTKGLEPSQIPPRFDPGRLGDHYAPCVCFEHCDLCGLYDGEICWGRVEPVPWDSLNWVHSCEGHRFILQFGENIFIERPIMGPKSWIEYLEQKKVEKRK